MTSSCKCQSSVIHFIALTLLWHTAKFAIYHDQGTASGIVSGNANFFVAWPEAIGPASQVVSNDFYKSLYCPNITK